MQAVGFHLIDHVVHGWDVARSLGLDHRLAPELAEPALRIALSVLDAGRGEPGAPFAPAVPANEDDPLHRNLAAVGRAPG
ncbi:hypothetical protein [Lentzea sp. NBRC 102530]|uniref:hypothetical protein n=1 Tax=Lentzea sp. NBRC 102530 TaxID=3032201 RepID=UPI0024A6059B|nr:hypothetical protein [Lentzea sp. NBRC 102530]GLY48994.1 hypothetical protein Lesp01_26500 [Lentzea sp. NBRC 102530]